MGNVIGHGRKARETYPLNGRARPSAEITLIGNAVPTDMPLNAAVPINPGDWSADVPPIGCTVDLAGGAIVCNTATRYWTIATVNYSSSNVSDPNEIILQIYKNGVPVPAHLVHTWTDPGFPNSATISGIADLVAGDTLTLVAKCTTNHITLTFTDANFSIAGI